MKKKPRTMLGAALIFAMLTLSTAIQGTYAYTDHFVEWETYDEMDGWGSQYGDGATVVKEYGESPTGTCYMAGNCSGNSGATVWVRAHFTAEETFTADEVGVACIDFRWWWKAAASISISEVYIETPEDDLVAYTKDKLLTMSISVGETPIQIGAYTFWEDLTWITPEFTEFTEDETYYIRVSLSISSTGSGEAKMDGYSTGRGTERGMALDDIVLRDN